MEYGRQCRRWYLRIGGVRRYDKKGRWREYIDFYIMPVRKLSNIPEVRKMKYTKDLVGVLLY